MAGFNEKKLIKIICLIWKRVFGGNFELEITKEH
jgi:hypothetical protein